jgi:hypothetical protein
LERLDLAHQREVKRRNATVGLQQSVNRETLAPAKASAVESFDNHLFVPAVFPMPIGGGKCAIFRSMPT